MPKSKSFNNLKNQLNPNDINQILEIVCEYCRSDTRNKIRRKLENFATLIPYYGILDRLIKNENEQWKYIAGQSYPDEIRTIRNLLKS
jgi:hypothetical protein